MADETERVEKPTEQVEIPSIAEEVKTPSQETKIPSLHETPEFKAELRKAQSSWDRQIALQKADASKYKAEAEQYKTQSASRQAQIEGLKKEVELALADDPERRQAYISRIAILEREQRLADREVDVERRNTDIAEQVWKMGMDRKAQELVAETSIPIDDFVGCHTEEEMEVKALRYKMAHPGGNAKPTEEKKVEEIPPKFDSAISTPGSKTGLSMDDIKKMKPGDFAKRTPEILKAIRDGKIPQKDLSKEPVLHKYP